MSDGGGPGGVAADALVAAGFAVGGPPELRRVRRPRRSDDALPGSAGANPVDLALGTIDPDAYARVVPVVAAAAEVDVVFAVGQLGYWSARLSRVRGPRGRRGDRRRARWPRLLRAAGMPLVVSTVYPEWRPPAALRAHGVPVYREVASAARSRSARSPGHARPGGVPVPAAAGPLR